MNNFLETHKHLIIWILALTVTLYLGASYLDRSAADAQTKAALAQQALDVQITANKQLKLDQDARELRYTQLVDSVNRQNASLISAITARDVALKQQQSVDASLPLDDLGRRWEALLGLPSASVQKTNTGVAVTEPAARTTVSALEELPVLQSKVADQSTMLANKDTQLVSLAEVSQGCSAQVAGLNAQIAAKDSQCSAQVAEIKTKARVSKLKWFAGGAITAIVAVLKFAL